MAGYSGGRGDGKAAAGKAKVVNPNTMNGVRVVINQAPFQILLGLLYYCINTIAIPFSEGHFPSLLGPFGKDQRDFVTWFTKYQDSRIKLQEGDDKRKAVIIMASHQRNLKVLDAPINTSWETRRIQLLRLSLVFFSLMDVAAHLFASPGATATVSYWIDIETAVYGLIAVIYLLGLRQYYGPPILFTAYNLVMFFVSGITALPFGITNKPLVGHIEFLQYSFGRGFSLLAWVYLLVVGIYLLKRDTGSKLAKLLQES